MNFSFNLEIVGEKNDDYFEINKEYFYDTFSEAFNKEIPCVNSEHKIYLVSWHGDDNLKEKGYPEHVYTDPNVFEFADRLHDLTGLNVAIVKRKDEERAYNLYTTSYYKFSQK